ncbi:MAG: hypothetical protein H7Y07_13380 [Pyrinomonadaceae bacterium]|nr:hypothetical protein [Sphingobacteriaceae bacterium]
MKKIYILLVLLPLYSSAQNINSFAGVNFGLSKDEAIKTISNTGAVVNRIDEGEELVYLTNLKLAGVDSKLLYMKFINDKFYEAIVEFEVNQSNFMQLFNLFKTRLIGSYGYGKDFSWLDTPYYFGDGQEFIALAKRKGKLCHAWGNPKNITSGNFVSIEVCADRTLRLLYRSHDLALIASKKGSTPTFSSNY